MIRDNAIRLVCTFYRQETTALPLWLIMSITGLSGIVETMPILAALPLFRSFYLGEQLVRLQSFETNIWSYLVFLCLLLVVRFLLGRYSQFINAKTRIHLMTQFRLDKSEEARKKDKVNYGKSVQSINFLLVGFSQFVPGVLFTLVAVMFAPVFTSITIAVMLIWALVLRRIKKKQDAWHHKAGSLSVKIDSLNKEDIHTLKRYRLKAAWFDATNKNSREIVIISALLVSLIFNDFTHIAPTFDSLLILVALLRGLQQLFTAYIMSQQLSGSSRFIKNVI